jgi:hypothetical protein
MRTEFWLENLNGGDHSEVLDADGDNIKMDFSETGMEGVDLINLAQGRDRWRMLNTEMNLRDPEKLGNFLSG